ncbi:hypothetical protein TNCV_1992441 [Trichonephila clavipes]|nr:hypothetical protein TNCV_1992441 [Trichonephila clavipes]
MHVTSVESSQTSSRWCGVVVRKERYQLRCRPRQWIMVQYYEVRRHEPISPRAAEHYSSSFGDGPNNFEPRSSDEDDTGTGTPSPNFHITPTRECLSFGRCNVRHPPTRRVFSGTGLELMTRRLRVHYLDHSATVSTHQE